MSGVQILTIGDEEGEQRLDRFLKRKFPQLSQGMIEKMARKGELRLDGGRVKSNSRVETGQKLRVPPLPDAAAPKRPVPAITPADEEFIKSLVIYRDADMIILNKPAGLAVQGGTKTERHIDGMAEGLKFNRETKPHLVHRLDRDTSGVLVLGRHPQAAARLSKLFQSRHIEKVYWSVVAGQPKPLQGRINLGLVKAGGHGARGEGEKMQIVTPGDVDEIKGAKRAATDYLVMEPGGGRLTWLAMSPLTGRTHQLRAHAAGIGHPILGDGKYGGSSGDNSGDGWGAGVGGDVSKKMHLHSRSLRFEHPSDGRDFFIAAPLPDHMKQTWDLFGWDDGRAADRQWEEAREARR